jgi:hypothetical protein
VQRDYLKVVTEEHAVTTLRSLSKLSPEEQNLEQERVKEFVQKELPNSWDEVVQQYNSYIL